MTEAASAAPVNVVIVGGGIAALEAVLALHDLAADRVAVTLIAPEPDFVLRPLAVAAPFSRGHGGRLPLAEVMAEHGGRAIRSAVARVDARANTLRLTTGEHLEWDVLVLAQGATEVPALPQALTFGEHPGDFSGLLADLEHGDTGSVAFVVPVGASWPMPLYELALLTAEEAWAMNMDRVRFHLVTPEEAPLELLGAEASAAVATLLEAAGIAFHGGVHPRMRHGGAVETGEGTHIVVDRVVALPVLEGRRLPGIPADAGGFIPVDDTGLVAGFDTVYAVGDVTDRLVKQGGLACQQADLVAAHIAARAGVDVELPPVHAVLRGRLLTGAGDRFLRRGAADEGQASAEPLWWPPSKVSGRYLAPYLEARGVEDLPRHADRIPAGIDIDVPVEHRKQVPGGSVEETGLRAITPIHLGLRG